MFRDTNALSLFRILNGMETRHPHDIYGMLWDELEPSGNGRMNSKKAATKLKKYFTTNTTDRSSELIVVMLDEIDYVVTKGQEVLYDMFDLPLLSMEKKIGKQLLMIGVSNMLNLPDKLHPRVQSRIGSARVFFKSYGVEETKAILHSKLKAASPNYDVFHSEAITYASKKTALMSGDIRKAFQMCKQAAELVLEAALQSDENKRTVLIDDVVRVSRDSFNSAQSRTIALCSSLEALLIVTLASLSKTTGREFGGFDVEELVTKMASVAHAHGDARYLPPPNLEETLIMLRNLGGCNLITLDTPQNASLSYRASLAGSGGAWPLVSLPIDDIAVLVALKHTDHYRLAEKHLGRQQ
jgi:origin recognition complex subunit 1